MTVESNSFRRIIVRVPNWIGDAVMCTPALMDLREACPTATITVWARPTIADLLQSHPSIDKIFVYENKGTHRGLFGKMSLIRALRKGQFDVAILFQNAFEAAWLTLLAGIPVRVGFPTDGRRLLLSRVVPIPGKKEEVHQVRYYQELIRRLFGKTSNRSPNLMIEEDEEICFTKKVPGLSFGKGSILIGINPGSVYGTAKRWMPERFAEVADRLLDNLLSQSPESQDVHCVLVGGPGEESLAQSIADQMRHKSIVLSGKTTVRELMAVIKRCSVFLTNDTGPMHIAAAFNVPLVSIFGPTDPANTAPFQNGQTIVRQPVLCSPCLLRHCPIDHRCMMNISVDDVYRMAISQFSNSPCSRTQVHA